MSRFEYLSCGYVNVDTISYCEHTVRTDEKCTVHFKNGESIKLSYRDEGRILGEDHIIQVIPCAEPVTAIYEDGDSDSAVCEVDVFYLGLCADGSIKPITLMDGYYDVINDINFKGLYEKENTWRKVKGKRLENVCLQFCMEQKGV